jgi:hypothetical protein
MKDYMLESMVSMCVFCWNLIKDYVLELIIACVYSTEFSDNLCAGIDYCMRMCVFMLKSCDLAGT